MTEPTVNSMIQARGQEGRHAQARFQAIALLRGSTKHSPPAVRRPFHERAACYCRSCRRPLAFPCTALPCPHQNIVHSIAPAEILRLLLVAKFAGKLGDARHQKIPQGYRRDWPAAVALCGFACDALDDSVGKQPVSEIGTLQRLLIPACRRIDYDVRLIAVAAQALVVAITSMAGVEKQDAAPLGAFDGLLEGVPRDNAGGLKTLSRLLRSISWEEAVVRSVIDAVPGDKDDHGVGFPGLTQHAQGVEDIGGRRNIAGACAIHQEPRHHALML